MDAYIRAKLLADTEELNLEDSYEKGIAKGIENGIAQGMEQVISRMLAKGKSIEEIADDTGIAVGQIKQMLEEF